MALLIRDAYIPLVGNDVTIASILIDEGIVKAIVKDVTKYISKADEMINAKGLIAIPGGIDIHAHIHDPDYTHHEDFTTGTTSCVYGGITTVFDMPLRMYVDSIEKLKIKVEEGLRKSLINFGIHAGMVNEDNMKYVAKLRSEGIYGFKVFTCKPFRPKTDAGIVKAIETIYKNDALPYIHAEDDSLIDYQLESLKNRNDPLAHHESRPAEAEAAAIRRVLLIAKFLNAKVHIAHVSSALGAMEIKRGKDEGIKVTAETCPQYLYFTRDDVGKWGNYLKMNPSLKSRYDVEFLWRSIANGTIDAIASDHAPSPRDEKEVNVWSAWGGIPSVEVMLPLIYTLGIKKLGIITISRFIDLVSRNPAKIMRIYPVKGELAVGSDADIALIDPNTYFKVDASKMHHKVDWTPYEGLELCGWPKYVVINGKLILSDGELIIENRAPKFISLKTIKTIRS